MDVLSFYVTASILALSFDVRLFFQAVLLQLADRGRKIEMVKELGDGGVHLVICSSLKIHKDARKSLFIAIPITHIANPGVMPPY